MSKGAMKQKPTSLNPQPQFFFTEAAETTSLELLGLCPLGEPPGLGFLEA